LGPSFVENSSINPGHPVKPISPIWDSNTDIGRKPLKKIQTKIREHWYRCLANIQHMSKKSLSLKSWVIPDPGIGLLGALASLVPVRLKSAEVARAKKTKLIWVVLVRGELSGERKNHSGLFRLRWNYNRAIYKEGASLIILQP